MSNYYYSGQGSLYIAERDSTTGKPKGFMPVGNVPELTINIETTKFEHKESESGSRLVDLTIVKEKKGQFEFKLENLSIDNLSLALWGTKATVVGATIAAGVAGELVVIPQGAIGPQRFKLAHPKISAVTVNDGATGLVPFTLNDDYTVDAANGMIILTAGGDIETAATASASSIKVSYTYAGYTKMDAFTESVAPERWLRFEGINTVDGSHVIVDMFRAQFDPMTGYGLINEEFASVSMKGSVLADSLQVTGSKFFRQTNSAA